MKNQIQDIILRAIKKAYPEINIPAFRHAFSVDEADAKFGDYSTNVALILQKVTGEKPQKIALNIINSIEKDDLVEDASMAEPGFINFQIALPFLQEKITDVIKDGEKYGSIDIGKNKKVDIEFISANPTGPLTVGNSRGGVIGDVLSNIYEKAGYKVTREYYFNDAGGQIDVLGHSILKDEEAQYRGDYVDKLAEEIKGNDPREVGKLAAQKLIENIKNTASNMGIDFDVWTAEGKDLRETGKLDEVIKWLKEQDLAYENDGALWFKSTEFGDDKDRVLVKSNGEPTYFALDCAYHKDKLETRKFDKAINIWGADHHGDLARVKGFVKALGYEEKFDILVHQFVRIVKDGKEVRMSKREGNFILVDDLLTEVGKDVYRFFMLEYAPNSHLTFDLELAKKQSQKNPVYYVQYAYARIASILAKSEALNPKCMPEGETNSKSQKACLKAKLEKLEEIALIKQLIKLPELVEEIVGDYQVQKLPNYARTLADSFHRFYEKCPVIKSGSDELTSARLELLKATQIVLKNTLDLMGISAPEKM